MRCPSVRRRTELGTSREGGGRLQPLDADAIVFVTSGTTVVTGETGLVAALGLVLVSSLYLWRVYGSWKDVLAPPADV